MYERSRNDSKTEQKNTFKIIPHEYLEETRQIELGEAEERVNSADIFPNLDLSGGRIKRREFTIATLRKSGRIKDIVSTIGGVTEVAFSPAELDFFISRAPQALRRGACGIAVVLERKGEFSILFITSASMGLSFRCEERTIDTEWEADDRVTFAIPGTPALIALESI